MPRDGAWRDGDDARPEIGPHDDDNAGDEWERARLAARRHFRTVPPYRIAPDDHGKLCLARKYYEFWGDDDPAAATHWHVLSRHDSFEEAERRKERVTSPPVSYDARGRLAQGPPLKEAYGLPPDDEDA